MILVNLSEKKLYNVFYEILEYFRSLDSDNLKTYQEENNNRKFLNLLTDEIHSHYKQILKDFNDRLISLYKKEICIEIKEDGRAELDQQIFNTDDFKRVFLDLYNRYREYESLKTLIRLLLTKTCIEEIVEKHPNIEVTDELVDNNINKYVLYCYTDDKFYPNEDYLIEPSIIRCFNQIKRQVEQYKEKQQTEVFDKLIEISIDAINNNKPEDFKEYFNSKLIGESYSENKNGYDRGVELVFNLLRNLKGNLSEIGLAEKYGFVVKELLFNWVLCRSLVYEVYVFRRLLDFGIPCAFHFVLKDKKGELDLVYCTESGVGVVEVKSGRFNKNIEEKMKLLQEYEINKYVVIHSSESDSSLEFCMKQDGVITMKFEDLNDVTKVAQLVKGL